MSELGQFLKTKREEQELSIEQLQEITKIQKRYLTAIEEGRYDSLPGAFYTRAFVKSYAEALGLHPDDVFESFGNELPQPKQQTTDLPSRAEKANPKVQKKKRRKSTFLPALMGVLFLVVVAAGVYLVVQDTNQESPEGSSPDEDPSIELDANEQTNSNEEEQTDEDSQNNADGEQQEDSSTEEPDTSANESDSEKDSEEKTEQPVEPEFVSTEDGNRSTYDVAGAKEMVIELELTGDAYLDVKDENGSKLEDLNGVEAGDTVEMDFSNQEYVKVNVGSTPNVTIRFNGQEIEYPIDNVHQHIIFDKQPE
ncbi:helix-turn-helix domain-containing protein [Salibacterium salarium]|uniref:helix-turn-helix domain-containing protein n=1 Tax=Salibacterium salarium TaxID=284579 RepID=UPI0016399A90|nr:helix-turn-helix domain-containing protein [Salibacterium salarium]